MLALVIEGFAVIGERLRAAELYPLARELISTGAVALWPISRLSQTVAGIAAAALEARRDGAGAKSQQQVARPAEQSIERERRVRRRVQEVEQRPQGEIQAEERRDLIEADAEVRGPAPAQGQ